MEPLATDYNYYTTLWSPLVAQAGIAMFMLILCLPLAVVQGQAGCPLTPTALLLLLLLLILSWGSVESFSPKILSYARDNCESCNVCVFFFFFLK